MAGKRKIGSAWEALTGTGPYYKPDSVASRFFSGESNILGRRSKKSEPSEVSVTARKRAAPVADTPKSTPPSEISVTAKKRPVPVADVPATKPKAATAKPKKPADTRRAREDIISSLGLDEDSAVAKAMRRRQSEGKALGAYAKGGKIDGCAQRGKTKLKRYV